VFIRFVRLVFSRVFFLFFFDIKHLHLIPLSSDMVDTGENSRPFEVSRKSQFLFMKSSLYFSGFRPSEESAWPQFGQHENP
jgi:hypothetical protein